MLTLVQRNDCAQSAKGMQPLRAFSNGHRRSRLEQDKTEAPGQGLSLGRKTAAGYLRPIAQGERAPFELIDIQLHNGATAPTN